MAGQVIQSILVPAETDVDVLKEMYGDEWFSRVKTENGENLDHYVRFTQRGEKEFDGTAFHLVDAGGTGAFFVCGALKEEKQDSAALTIPSPSRLAVPVEVTPTRGGNQMTKEDVQGIVTRTVTQEVRSILETELTAVLKEGLTRVEAALGAVEKITRAHNEAGQAVESDLRTALDELSRRLKTFESELKAVAKRQESLEHTTLNRPSVPEDPVFPVESGDDYDPAYPSKAFKGMFDQMPL